MQIVTADLASPDTFLPALKDIDKIFLLSTGPNSPTHDANLVAAANRSDVTHIVKLSALGIDKSNNVLADWHVAGERAVT